MDENLTPNLPEGQAPPVTRAEPYRWTSTGWVWIKMLKDGPVPTPISNFTAQIMTETVVDDGVAPRTLFEIEGQVAGRPPHRFTISADDFADMRWPMLHLGAEANIFAGHAFKEKVRDAIQRSSGGVVRRTVYAHTGWRQLADGRWVYLHGGGAVGAERAVPEVAVQLEDKLARFILPDPPTDARLVDAVRASLSLLDVAPLTITVPLLGATYLAPLREFLGDHPPDFTPWLHGPSQIQKSELAALAQSHYGPFARTTLPASFEDTENAHERVLSVAKDALLGVDDFCPASRPKRDGNIMRQKAARLVRNVGNGAGRGRMTVDTTLRPDLPPRALPLVTAEEVLTGHSTLGRTFPIAVAPGAVDLDRLTVAQRQRDLLAQAMSGYVQWIARNAVEIRKQVVPHFLKLRDKASRSGGFAREPSQVAHLYLGLETLLMFAARVGAITREREAELRAVAWRTLTALTAEQRTTLAQETPAERFLALLRDGFASKRIYVEAKRGGLPEDPRRWGWEPDGNEEEALRRPHAGQLVGWFDRDHVLLIPEAAKTFLYHGNESLPAWPTLLKRLEEIDAIVTASDGGSTKRTVPERVGADVQKVVKLKVAALWPTAGVDDPVPPQTVTDAEDVA